jgi:hypothetical protein
MPRDAVRLVTGYVRLDNGNRSHADYAALGSSLLTRDIPTTAFIDPIGTADIAVGPRVDVRPTSLDECWLYRTMRDAIIPAGNPRKDTIEYHAVQHQKSAWLAAALAGCEEDFLVWIDFGLLHVPGVTARGIDRMVGAVTSSAPRDRITIASIWGPPGLMVDPGRIAWNCAGGVLVVPSIMAEWFDAEVRAAAEGLYRMQRRVTWEVNTWAMVWTRHRERFAHYRCDHNASILEVSRWQ